MTLRLVLAALLCVARAATAQSDSARIQPPARRDSARVPLVPRPPVVRGLYVSRWATIGHRLRELIGVAKRTEINALVIDVKDDRGYVL